jgi:predicted nucleic acid-binding Zn ribbon protein
MGLAQKVKEAQIVRDWASIVGEAISRHCQPVSLNKGYLTVNVDSSPWLNELQRFSKGMILQKIQARVGERVIRDIRFRIGEVKL